MAPAHAAGATSAADELWHWAATVSVLCFAAYPVGLLLYQISIANSAAGDASPVEHEKASDEKPDADKVPPPLESSALSTFLSCLVWPSMCLLPLSMTLGGAWYRHVFPSSWYDEQPMVHDRNEYGLADPRVVKPLGLTLGILAVVVGQVFTVIYHMLRREHKLGGVRKIQTQPREYVFFSALRTHLSNPEGFVLIGGYLVGTWMLGLMPASYYSFQGGINWFHVAAQLLLQDFIQYLMHLGEHKISSWIYRHSHKPHHRFTNPIFFDAFDGSLTDTLLMIIVPFIFVARIVPANVWSYMAFGSMYANWLVLIHAEYRHPWDGVFRKIGFGTSADHHVHHRLFVYNYGHLFMYWDRLLGTFKDPSELVPKYFNDDDLKQH
eukprot:TRINITY_DN24165_c0_g1_i1.p1 TRINITY_DN24165_c0_g1~~TRINITY_DN24165_c0_g1_i1.p1  ORF type:complete len:380 (-),score=72.04 TRINITY_DN24165_c0_g1_i1:266-1405(-)